MAQVLDFGLVKNTIRVYLAENSWVDVFPLPAEITSLKKALEDEMRDAKPGHVVTFGNVHEMHRTQKVYGHDYPFAGAEHKKSEMAPCVEAMLAWANKSGYGSAYNGALVNRYADGTETIGLHSDDLKHIVCSPSGEANIIGLNFGARRKMQFRSKQHRLFYRPPAPGTRVVSDGNADIVMYSGTGYVMGGQMQSTHKHGISREMRVFGPRISITLRQFAT